MRYRFFGKTGIKVSEIGFGTWGIGGATEDGANSYGETDDAESKKCLKRAFDLGINFYDTSNIYGYGHSEELLGEVFKSIRDKVIIASKVGFVKHGGPHDFRGSYIRSQLENTLKRLQSDYVDVYQLHSPPLEQLRQTEGVISTMVDLKKEGKIRAFAISVKNPKDAFAAVQEFGAEIIQTNFNMIDQRASELGIFDLVKKNSIGLIARTPLAFGFLSGKIKELNFNPQDHRSSWSENQLKIWAKASDLFSFINKNPNRTATQLALQFCLSFDSISTVIPGMLHLNEVEENAATSDLPALTKEELINIDLIYKQNTFFEKQQKL